MADERTSQGKKAMELLQHCFLFMNINQRLLAQKEQGLQPSVLEINEIQEECIKKNNDIFNELLENDGKSQFGEIYVKTAIALCEDFLESTRRAKNSGSHFLILDIFSPGVNSEAVVTISTVEERIVLKFPIEAVIQAKGRYGMVNYLEVSVLSCDLNNDHKLVSFKHPPVSGPLFVWVSPSKLVRESQKSQVG